jgi:plastocyanin
VRPVAILLLFFLSLVPALAPGATVVITNDGNTFDPDAVTISVGDTVRWEWDSGSHTVTSGTGSGDPNVGDLFDQGWNTANRTLTHRYMSAGSFPFFCRTHEFLSMTGTVTVQDLTPVEPITWGMVKKRYGHPSE